MRTTRHVASTLYTTTSTVLACSPASAPLVGCYRKRQEREDTVTLFPWEGAGQATKMMQRYTRSAGRAVSAAGVTLSLLQPRDSQKQTATPLF